MIFVISLCFCVFGIASLLFIYQIENTNNCITLLKGGWSLGAQEDRTAESESESELFTGDTSKDNHSPGPVFREVSP